ncbi:Rap1a/Tai family immunity protein [Microbulbifer sp. CnH-101-E]|uniref:Rap1a/Tai family immunity protein n=1 Tax=unclassified Microbulbifer TaxID=2619833 RepID=UPI00403908C6
MNKILTPLMTLLLLVMLNPAYGNTELLLDKCKSVFTEQGERKKNYVQSGIDAGFCLGYLRGISDFATVASIISPNQLNSIKSCRPEGVTNKQLAKIVVQTLEVNPQTHHMDMISAVTLSLRRAFPCEGSDSSMQ